MAAFTTKDGQLTSDPLVQSEMLRQQYNSVASKAIAEFQVKNRDAFFMCDNDEQVQADQVQAEQVQAEQVQFKQEQDQELEQKQECPDCMAQWVHACTMDQISETDETAPDTACSSKDSVNVPYGSQSPYRKKSPYEI